MSKLEKKFMPGATDLNIERLHRGDEDHLMGLER